MSEVMKPLAPGSMLPGHAHVEDSGKVRLCAAYVGADCETVDWAAVGQQIGYDQLQNQLSQGVNLVGQRALPNSRDGKDAWIAQLETKLAGAYTNIAVLEADVAHLTLLLHNLDAELQRRQDFASRAEGELVDRVEAGNQSFPVNALKYSR